MAEPSEFVIRRTYQLLCEKVVEPHRELARSLAEDANKKLDDDMKGFLDESHIAFGAMCSYEAYKKLAEHNASFELQWRALMRGTEKWREANPGNDLVMPDMANLIAWLLEQAFPEEPQ